MSKLTIKIHNIETNEIVEREMTDAEIKNYNETQSAKAAARAEATAKAVQRQAILDHLKITEEEARILLGGN